MNSFIQPVRSNQSERKRTFGCLDIFHPLSGGEGENNLTLSRTFSYSNEVSQLFNSLV